MSLEKIINDAWENKDQVNQNSDQNLKDAINQVIADLDSGKSRVAEKINGEWVTHQHLKKAIMLSFRIYPMENLNGPYSSWYDKSHLLKGKTAGWTKADHEKAGFRMVPNSPVRKGSFVGKNAVLMPCYVNIGAYIDEGTMIDTFARAGSCCQIGKNCHISAGSGVGGVLEPAQALPTIIEDNVFLGAMSEVVEGVIVGEGSVLSMGMYIGQSTKIVERKTGKITYGKIPPYSVVVPGSLPDKNNSSAPSLYCAVIIKQVDEKTRSKTSINDLFKRLKMKTLNELKLAKELIRFPSITPVDAGVMKFLEKKLKKLGFKTKILEFKERGFQPVKNLYARLGSKKPNFMFAGHVDIVPPGNIKDWTVNPFKPSIKKGHLIGRGANDMKSSVAAFVSAVSTFLSKNRKFNGSISLLITGDEEGDAVNGTKKVVDYLKKGKRKLTFVLLVNQQIQIN